MPEVGSLCIINRTVNFLIGHGCQWFFKMELSAISGKATPSFFPLRSAIGLIGIPGTLLSFISFLLFK